MMMLRLSNRSTKKPIGKPAASYQSIVKIGGAVMLLLVPLLLNVRVLSHLNFGTVVDNITLSSFYKIKIGQCDSVSKDFFHRRRQLRALRDFGHANKIFGHVHVAKTGGSSINVMLANKFERVCGHKGYSYDAYADNVRARQTVASGGRVIAEGRSRVSAKTMEEIGFEDCDYVSNEIKYGWWISTFGDNKFHNLQMELHVPCRDPVDHLMSQCNHRRKKLACDAATDEEYFKSVHDCLIMLDRRFNNELENHFDVKCYAFNNQFTGYVNYLSTFLDKRFITAEEIVQRHTNYPRDRDSECIWKRPDLLEKTRKYLVESVSYYRFCDKCLGTENEIGICNATRSSSRNGL